MKKLVVLTGSFNPITKAHRILLESAINKVGADLGLFVITNDDYLIKKNMVDSKTPTSFHLNEKVREEMINSLNKINNQIKFGIPELGKESPSTLRTLKYLNKMYKDYKIFYMVGADKLSSVPNWKDFDKLFDQFGFVVSPRSGYDVNKIINDSELLSKNKENIIVMDNIVEISDISSTKIRDMFFKGEDYKDLMDEGPYEILKRYTKDDFKDPTPEDVIKYTIMYGGRFGGNASRIKVYKENDRLFNNWNTKLFGDKNIVLNNTKVYKEKFDLPLNNNRYDTIIECVNKDCVDVTEELLNEGFNPVILNTGCGVTPCGGYDKGRNTIEEMICYMSTLSQSLFQFGNVKYKRFKIFKDNGNPNYPGVYPLDINYGSIYSPNITFFRNNFDKYYSLREKTFTCSVITVPTLSNLDKFDFNNDERKYFNEDNRLNEEGKEIEKNKIRTILRIGLLNNHDSIVLNQFGSKVYNLLPEEISLLFKNILEEDEFKGKYKKVIFSIYEGEGTKRKLVGKEGEYKSFYDLFMR